MAAEFCLNSAISGEIGLTISLDFQLSMQPTPASLQPRTQPTRLHKKVRHLILACRMVIKTHKTSKRSKSNSKYMGGVDLNDMLTSFYSDNRKTVKLLFQ